METMSPDIAALLDGWTIEINNPHLTKSIKGFENIYSFFNQEKIFWDTITSKHAAMLPGEIGSFSAWFNQIINNCNEIKHLILIKNLDNIQIELDKCKHTIIKIIARKIYFSITPQGQFIADLIKSNKSQFIVLGAHDFLQNSQFQSGIASGYYKDYFVGYVKAYEFDYQEDTKILKRRNAEKQALKTLQENWIEIANKTRSEANEIKTKHAQWESEITQKVATWSEEKDKQIDELLSNAKKAIKENEELYRIKLRLEGPVKYWKERTKNYRSRGYVWLGCLAVITISIITLLITVLYNLPPVFEKSVDKIDLLSIKSMLIFLTALSFGAYLIRVFSKLTFSSFHLARDSEEREQLTHVYLALKANHSFSIDPEAIVLQAIFSRTDTGLLGGDHSIAMPGIGQALENVASGKK